MLVVAAQARAAEPALHDVEPKSRLAAHLFLKSVCNERIKSHHRIVVINDFAQLSVKRACPITNYRAGHGPGVVSGGRVVTGGWVVGLSVVLGAGVVLVGGSVVTGASVVELVVVLELLVVEVLGDSVVEDEVDVLVVGPTVGGLVEGADVVGAPVDAAGGTYELVISCCVTTLRWSSITITVSSTRERNAWILPSPHVHGLRWNGESDSYVPLTVVMAMASSAWARRDSADRS